MQRKNQNFLRDIGDTIRLRRVDCGLSQEELGKRCGVHRSYITEIEGGMRNVSVLTIEKLAKALGLQAWRLLRFEHLNDDSGELAEAGDHNACS